jgi:hypothetical protein
MAILVKNKHTYKGNGIWIGGGGVFGNKFGEDLQAYNAWLGEQWAGDAFFQLSLGGLVKDHLRGKDVVMVCGCDNEKTCHGHLINELIVSMADLGVVTLNTTLPLGE